MPSSTLVLYLVYHFLFIRPQTLSLRSISGQKPRGPPPLSSLRKTVSNHVDLAKAGPGVS